jgi:hypothetical protein
MLTTYVDLSSSTVVSYRRKTNDITYEHLMRAEIPLGSDLLKRISGVTIPEMEFMNRLLLNIHVLFLRNLALPKIEPNSI